MTGCAVRAEAIAECALGKTPEPDVAAHLAICPGCSNALQESRAMAGRIDEALHRAGMAEPPPYGPERVIARVQGQTNTGGSWTRKWWRWAAAGGLVLAVLIAAVMWVRRPAPEADVVALSAWRSPTQALLRPPVAAAWTTVPRLGEGFFKFKLSGEIHER